MHKKQLSNHNCSITGPSSSVQYSNHNRPNPRTESDLTGPATHVKLHLAIFFVFSPNIHCLWIVCSFLCCLSPGWCASTCLCLFITSRHSLLVHYSQQERVQDGLLRFSWSRCNREIKYSDELAAAAVSSWKNILSRKTCKWKWLGFAQSGATAALVARCWCGLIIGSFG